MNYLGLTVFAGNTPGLILDFFPETKEYLVEFTDGRVVRTSKVYWDKTIPSEPDIAFYRQSSLGNGEQLIYDSEIGWDIVSAIDIVDEPSDLNDWVDDYKEDAEADHSSIEDKLNEVLDTLNELVEKDKSVHEKLNGEDDSAVQKQDHDATEDSYWDRSTKPNPMAYDEEFPAGQYNERNPGTLNPTAKTAKDCGCWEGYKRVPGTEPCAPGSCEKCDSARKKESAAKKKKHDADEAVKKINRVPPEGVRSNARRALKYIEEGKAGDGFQAATADRARRIAAGEELTEEHINRMHSFFERHAGGRSKKAKPGEITAWDVAWLAWGGDSGRSWAAKVDAQLHKARHPGSKGKHSSVKESDNPYAMRRKQVEFNTENMGDLPNELYFDVAKRFNIPISTADQTTPDTDIGYQALLQEAEKVLHGDSSSDPRVNEVANYISGWLQERGWTPEGYDLEERPHDEFPFNKQVASATMYWDPASKDMSVGYDRDEDLNRSDIGGNSNVRHAEGEAQKNQHGDQEGNPEMLGLGSDTPFPAPPLDVAKIIRTKAKDIENPNTEVWERMFSHVREENEWEDMQFTSTAVCPKCSDPLVNNKCYVCGEDKTSYVQKIDGLIRVAQSLQPQAAELGRLFGLALAGNKESVTQPSEGIFAIEIHGVDSHPENGGTGNYNAEHGDSPEYLKDVNHGGGGWIDATPEMIVEGMPKVIELSESDESGEGNKIVKSLERFFDEVFGDEFKDNKEKAKKEKNSSAHVSNGIPGAIGYGQTYPYQGGQSVPQQTNKAVGVEQTPVANDPNDNYCRHCEKNFVPGKCSYSQNNNLAPKFCEALANQMRQAAVEGITDIDGNPVEEGETYRVFAGVDEEPDVVRITNVSPSGVSVTRIDSVFPDNEGQPYEISNERFSTEDMRFDKADELNPNEIGIANPDPLDGTPETMDDAGPGHNDIPGQRDLSNRSMASTQHMAGRHYYPNQQKEFINENGKARNLDKLVLEGTHYVDNETTANIDDDFLFGV